ncbi:WD repeat-containing protein CG11141 isoform X2 [Ischnura elegans]|uniref:WD repeat-containing protein CG11141 isoform X2 n=1 Tax=Ischnura elegans TaxID=197161 RepID=UPI001ED87737|nr:WD repeat-containing protein CG11141 isoform X2 [Ischnura elegans]
MGEQSEFKTLREWTPMSRLLQKIPLKAQRGLFTHDLNLTCVDCLPDYLVLGTNVGLVYWYDRRKDELQRLRCENTPSPIVCIRLVSTTDFMVAAGSEDGNVSVFQIPKPEPTTIPPVSGSTKSRQIERFTVSGLHSSPVTALEWSKNGTNLFSGDRLGIIVLTEIDFYMHLSKSREVLNEKYEVVQLSYHCGVGIPQGKLLLVSTVYRTTLCSWKQEERAWKVAQLGQRERKALGQFGATFYHPPGMGNAHHRDIIFASRPGLRLWQAGLDGIVQQTLIFKDALMCPHPSIMLVNPVPSRFKQTKGSAEKNLGRRRDSDDRVDDQLGIGRPDALGFQHQVGFLHPFDDGLLVAHWKGPSGSILVLDPEDTGVIASVKTGAGGLRSIISVAVTPSPASMELSQGGEMTLGKGPEIFVLEGGRSLIRISNLPDYHYSKALEEPEEGLGSSVRSLFSSTIFQPSLLPSPPPLLKDLTASLLELTTGPGASPFKAAQGESSSLSRGDAGSSAEAEVNPPSPKEKEVGFPREKGPKHVGVVMADEALEVPPVVGLPFEEVPALLTSSTDSGHGPLRGDPLAKGAEAGGGLTKTLSSAAVPLVNEEIIYKPKKRKKKKKSTTLSPGMLEPEGSSARSTASEEETPKKTGGMQAGGDKQEQGNGSSREDLLRTPGKLPLGGDGVKRRSRSEQAVAAAASSVNLRSSMVEEGHVGGVETWLPSMPLAPDLRSPTSIRQDVESKEELLARLLDLKPIIPVSNNNQSLISNNSGAGNA